MAEVDSNDATLAMLRVDFAFFLRFAFNELGGEGHYCHNWHIDAIIHQLNRVRKAENRRLMVTMPPRHLKSITISIAWTAWILGHNPALKFLCVSYGQDLADDHARNCLKIMQSRWYKAAFPRMMLARRSIADFSTTAGGGRISTSVDGVTTGFGADIIIVDDPMKAQDAMSPNAREKIKSWFHETLIQRLNNQETGAILVVMQRLHEDDLVGLLQKDRQWHELCLPAIAEKDEAIPMSHGRSYCRREGCALHPARMSLATLLERKAANPLVFASQYQQAPVPTVGNIIDPAWLKTYDSEVLDASYGEIVQSWDSASKDNPFSDFSVCVTALIRGKSIYILDVFRARLEFHALKAKAIALAQTHGASTVLIEDAASGTALIQSLRADDTRGVPYPIARRPEGDKLTRAMGASAMIQAGRLFLPSAAHWLGDFTSELLGFPLARNDDQVDALSQLLNWVQQRDMVPDVPLAAPEELADAIAALENTPYYDDDDPWAQEL
ncbi:MAG: phage terminase large subunit [Pseudomonadota bacterium]